MRVYRWSNLSFAQVTTATTTAGGAYTVTNLNPGNYRVGFTAAGMTPEFYLDKTDVEVADDVAVALNGTAAVNAHPGLQPAHPVRHGHRGRRRGRRSRMHGAHRAAGADPGRREVATRRVD